MSFVEVRKPPGVLSLMTTAAAPSRSAWAIPSRRYWAMRRVDDSGGRQDDDLLAVSGQRGGRQQQHPQPDGQARQETCDVTAHGWCDLLYG